MKEVDRLAITDAISNARYSESPHATLFVDSDAVDSVLCFAKKPDNDLAASIRKAIARGDQAYFYDE